MKKRIYFLTRTLWDLTPAIWEATKYKNFDVGVFRCNEFESWERYLEAKTIIARIVNPNYKPERKKGHIKTDLLDQNS